MALSKKLLSTELEDNAMPMGGISFMGETLQDFMEEMGLPLDTDIKTINKVLKECGIKCLK